MDHPDPQCGRTFPHWPHETTEGRCPGLPDMSYDPWTEGGPELRHVLTLARVGIVAPPPVMVPLLTDPGTRRGRPMTGWDTTASPEAVEDVRRGAAYGFTSMTRATCGVRPRPPALPTLCDLPVRHQGRHHSGYNAGHGWVDVTWDQEPTDG